VCRPSFCTTLWSHPSANVSVATAGRQGAVTCSSEMRGGKITALYEVKTDCTTTSLYTGTGQLLLNGLTEEKEPRLVLVVPGEPDETTKRVLDRLHVEVLTYRWVNGKPVFPKQSALLEGAPPRGAETIAGRRVMGLEDFTDEDIAALEQTHAQEASKAFDDETKSS
jgi:hypothetical protein